MINSTRLLVDALALFQRIEDLAILRLTFRRGVWQVVRVRHDKLAQVRVADKPDASFRARLPDAKGFHGRFVPVGRRRQNQRVKSGAAHAGDRATLADGRQA